MSPAFTLSNGVAIPGIGIGTWQIPDGAATYDAVAFALANGYRHVDTARAYGNEASVGRALRDSRLPRDEVFITSKLPAEIKDAAAARASFEATMQALQLDRLDLYLIHAPWPWNRRGQDHARQNSEVWRVFENLYEAGRVRAIGVSNFDVNDLRKIMADCRVAPMVDQIKFFIGNTQHELVDFCRAHDIQVEGYSPLATGALLGNADVRALAERHGVSVAQICIRYVLQKGVVALPKSVTPARIIQNRQVDFQIGAEDMDRLDRLTATVAQARPPSLLSRLKARIRGR
ncbi:MAG TPA: aldo/keto reductase [Burkholderiaceae bacterium]|nr:aldo/keto reductase [Burkholderiaceae bacterium]